MKQERVLKQQAEKIDRTYVQLHKTESTRTFLGYIEPKSYNAIEDNPYHRRSTHSLSKFVNVNGSNMTGDQITQAYAREAYKILRPMHMRTFKDFSQMTDQEKREYVDMLFREDVRLQQSLAKQQGDIKEIKEQLVADAIKVYNDKQLWSQQVHDIECMQKNFSIRQRLAQILREKLKMVYKKPDGVQTDPNKCMRCRQMKACTVHPDNLERINRFNQQRLELKNKKVNKIIINKSQINFRKPRQVSGGVKSDRLAAGTSFSAYTRNKASLHTQNANSVSSHITKADPDNPQKLVAIQSANQTKSTPFFKPLEPK